MFTFILWWNRNYNANVGWGGFIPRGFVRFSLVLCLKSTLEKEEKLMVRYITITYHSSFAIPFTSKTITYDFFFSFLRKIYWRLNKVESHTLDVVLIQPWNFCRNSFLICTFPKEILSESFTHFILSYCGFRLQPLTLSLSVHILGMLSFEYIKCNLNKSVI